MNTNTANSLRTPDTHAVNCCGGSSRAVFVHDSTIKVFWSDGQYTNQGWALYDMWAAWAYR